MYVEIADLEAISSVDKTALLEVATVDDSTPSGYESKKLTVEALGNAIVADVESALAELINKSFYKSGDVVSIPTSSTFSGIIGGNKKDVYLNIPLSKPSTATRVVVGGNVMLRGNKGLLTVNGSNTISLTGNTASITPMGVTVKLTLSAEASNVDANVAISAIASSAINMTFM